jgi:hypothetical protein
LLLYQSGMVEHACNTTTQRVEAGGSQVQSHTGPQSETQSKRRKEEAGSQWLTPAILLVRLRSGGLQFQATPGK